MSSFPDKGKSYKLPEEYSDLPNSKDIHAIKWVDLVISRRKKERRLLVVTEWEFFLFKSKRFSSTLQLATQFRWLDITKLSCQTLDDATIEFSSNDTTYENKNISASGEPSITVLLKKSKMFLRFYQYICSYSLEDEYPEFDYPSSFDSQIEKASKHNIIFHINMRLRSNGHSFPKSIQSVIQRFLTKQNRELKLNKLKILQESLPYFYECMHWFPFVNKIIVPFQSFSQQDATKATDANTNQIQADPIAILQSFVPSDPYINELEFKGRVPLKFSDLIDSILKSQKEIRTVTFNKCDLDNTQCQSLSDWIQTGTIEYLYLISSLSPVVVNSFVESLKNNQGTEILKKFIIYQSPGIDIIPLITYLPLIRYISLAYCDFEIYEFFYIINNLPQTSQIETAILSGNRNGRIIQSKQKYPPYLRELNLSDIIWEQDSFKNLFITFMAHQPQRNSIDNSQKSDDEDDENIKNSQYFDDGGFDSDDGNNNTSNEPLLKIDMSNAKMKEESWNYFFKYVQTMKPSDRLGTIRWSSNQLHKVFLLFLEKCTNLSSITFDGCFSYGDSLLPICVAYLSETRQRIRNFSCAGTTRKWLGPEGSKIIIQCLANNRTITHVNLSNNRSGKQMFIDLARILNKNRFVESILIDGNDVTNLNTYKKFFTSLRERGKPLKVNWPEQEMNDILQYGTATKDMIEKVKEIYDDVINGTFNADLSDDNGNNNKNKKGKNNNNKNANNEEEDNDKSESSIVEMSDTHSNSNVL